MTHCHETAAIALLARLVALAPGVWPGLAVEAEWKTALTEAQAVVKKETEK